MHLTVLRQDSSRPFSKRREECVYSRARHGSGGSIPQKLRYLQHRNGYVRRIETSTYAVTSWPKRIDTSSLTGLTVVRLDDIGHTTACGPLGPVALYLAPNWTRKYVVGGAQRTIYPWAVHIANPIRAKFREAAKNLGR